jgi:membrane-bound metal-dependent hydrolase YbcI (DUF457 family)
MPSPIGHALGGLAAGWLIARAPASRPSRDNQRTAPWTSTWRGALVFAAVAMVPDLDFLIGQHRMYTHSLGAASIVMLAAMVLTRSSATRTTAGLACGAAYASHILLDWLGSDAAPPIGLMALWPISSEYYESSLHLFMSTTRRYGRPGFWAQNFTAVAWEVGILLPIAAAIYGLRRRKE